MAKLWHLIMALVILSFLVSIILIEKASQTNEELTFKTFIPLYLLIAIALVLFAFWKLFLNKPDLYGSSSTNSSIRGGLSMAEAKFIAASHLLNNHCVDIFSIGDTPDTAKYIENLSANRCYPAAGEEAWYIRLKLTDERYFQGLPTKILIYMDGMGNVTFDPIMNNLSFLNYKLWNNPERHYIKGLSKTSSPRSLKDIVTRHVEETGNFPKDFQPTQDIVSNDDKK